MKEVTVIREEYMEVRNKFVKDNKLEEAEANTNLQWATGKLEDSSLIMVEVKA